MSSAWLIAATLLAHNPDTSYARITISPEKVQTRLTYDVFTLLKIVELDDNAVLSLPPSFEINLPTKDVAVHVDLVWQSRTNEGSWLCGAALSQTDTATASAWHGLVDALA